MSMLPALAHIYLWSPFQTHRSRTSMVHAQWDPFIPIRRPERQHFARRKLATAKLINIASRAHLANFVKSLSVGLEPLYFTHFVDYFVVVEPGCLIGLTQLHLAVFTYLTELLTALTFALPRLRNVQDVRIVASLATTTTCFVVPPTLHLLCGQSYKLRHN